MAYIMVVDDDQDFASAVATVLEQDGHQVHVKNDTADALDAIQTHVPDLMVLDVMFPEDHSAGFEFARTLHHSETAVRKIPILMLTAVNSRYPLGFSVNSNDIDEEWLPVSDFLEKPVDFDILKEKVRQLLAKASA